MTVFFAPRGLKLHLKQQLPSNNELTDEQLLLLHNIFGDLIMKALLIIECGSITIERSKSSQHQLFRVESNSGVLNYCSNYTRYCRCFNTIQKYIDPLYELWCEHNLAIFLAELMGKTKVIYLHDDVFCRSIEMLYSRNVHSIDSSVELTK
ncbi:hypothetical protein MN116_004574 [Schistosoma mekongi]|uniref:SWIM-type domain-containing protein n=1 Tax=Schistosoma mekongi TaxID=38744 RepID=A0AAE1ZCQ0_SCHME|nr:hypothetical protein MN116_004574 [Schistosoma mekongi]